MSRAAVVVNPTKVDDGEVMGSTRQLTVTAQPAALLLRMPPGSA
jgi:hypothetical protein